MSVKILSALQAFGDKFDVGLLSEPLPKFPAPVVGPHPVTGPDTPDKSSRNSHHVPAFKLAGMFADELGKVGSTLGSGPKKKDLTPAGQKMLDAQTLVNEMAHGEGLTAILVHNATHKTADGAAIHSSGMVDEILRRLGPINEQTGQERIKIMNEGGKGLSVNPRTEQYEEFFANCRTQVQLILNAQQKSTKTQQVELAEAKDKALTDKTQADAQQLVVAGVKELMRVAFSNALDQGVAAIDAALAVSVVDGDAAERSAAVGKVRTEAPQTWAPILNAAS